MAFAKPLEEMTRTKAYDNGGVLRRNPHKYDERFLVDFDTFVPFLSADHGDIGCELYGSSTNNCIEFGSVREIPERLLNTAARTCGMTKSAAGQSFKNTISSGLPDDWLGALVARFPFRDTILALQHF